MRLAPRCAAPPQSNDLIVTCGGVSVGEEDHLRPAVEREGRLDLWQVAIKPGKPLAFGEVFRADGSSAWFIGLPGNPVSSFVTFLLAVRPVILRAAGRDRPRAAADRAARRLRLAARRPAARVPARAPQCRRRPRPVPQPGLGRADVDALGRRAGRQPGRPDDRASATPSATCRSPSCSDERLGALLRLAARGAGQRRERSRSRPAPTSAALRAALVAPRRRAMPRRSAARRSCAAPATASSATKTRCWTRATRSPSSRRSPGAEMNRPPPRVSIQADDFDLGAEVAALRAGDAGVGAVCRLHRHGARSQRRRGGRLDGARALPGHDRGGDRGDDRRRRCARFEIRAVRVIHRIGVLAPMDADRSGRRHLGAPRPGLPGLRVPDGLPEDAGAVLEEGGGRRRRALGRRAGRRRRGARALGHRRRQRRRRRRGRADARCPGARSPPSRSAPRVGALAALGRRPLAQRALARLSARHAVRQLRRRPAGRHGAGLVRAHARRAAAPAAGHRAARRLHDLLGLLGRIADPAAARPLPAGAGPHRSPTSSARWPARRWAFGSPKSLLAR